MKPIFFYAGVFLVSCSTLMLEIIQTRILSVVVWYHLAFFVISLAMFGLTAGAVWVYLNRIRFTGKTLSYDLSYFSALFALTTAICLAVQMTLAPVVTRLATTFWIWAELALCVSVPFFFSGVIISLALTRSPFRIGRVYGVDLLGAAAGCLGALMLLDLTDGPSAVLWVGAIVAAGALFFSASAIGIAPEPKPPLHSWLQHRYGTFFFSSPVPLLIPKSNTVCNPLPSKVDSNFRHRIYSGSGILSRASLSVK